jgi:ParB family chromosome partitioning protein
MTKSEFKALGKGLSSLIRDKSLIETERDRERIGSLVEILTDNISPNSNQPRKNFKEEEILELSKSIESYGILQPILLDKLKNGKYEIIAGERRWRAAKLANLKTIPAIIKDSYKKESMEISLIENVQREDLNPLEEGYMYKKLIVEHNYTQEDIAKKIGKSRSYIANLLRLIKLPDKFKKLLAEDKLSAGHARLLLNYKNPDALAKIIQENKLSVRDAESIVSDKKEPLKVARNAYKTLKDPDLINLEKKLERILNLKTIIKIGEKNSSVTVKFNNMDEFDYIIAVLSEKPQLKF